jgi:hydrogenase-4 component B
VIAAGLALTAAAVLISWCAGFGRTDTMQVRIGVLAWTANIAAAVVFVVAGAVGLA